MFILQLLPVVIGIVLWIATASVWGAIAVTVALEIIVAVLVRPAKGKDGKSILDTCSKEALTFVAKNSPDEALRYKMAEKVNDEELWQYMALHDGKNFHGAVFHCKDIPFLKKLEAMQEDSGRQFDVGKRVSDLSEKIVENYINFCNDNEILYAIATKGQFPIPEGSNLYYDPRKKACLQALNRMTDETLLSRIATETSNEKYAQIAVRKITSNQVLAEIALNTQKYANAKAVLEKLADRQTLQFIAEHISDKKLKKKARIRIAEENSKELCGAQHLWEPLRSDSEDDGDSPRFDWVWEKCSRCGRISKKTYIVSKLVTSEIYYEIDGVEEQC